VTENLTGTISGAEASRMAQRIAELEDDLAWHHAQHHRDLEKIAALEEQYAEALDQRDQARATVLGLVVALETGP
jgi:hypothetical protein